MQESNLTARNKDRLSWSRIETLHLCPQKYAYKYEEGLSGGTTFEYEAADGSSKTGVYQYDYAMQFGTAIHAALASIYQGTAFVPVHCPCEDTCTFCERLYFSQGPKEGFYKSHWMYNCLAQFLLHYPLEPDRETEKRNPRTRETGVSLIHAYLDKWKRENFEVIAVEQEFQLEFEEFDYVGVIDLIVRQNGRLSPWDHKSTTYFGEMFERQFKISGQFTGYIDGTEACLKEPVLSATANGLRVSTKVDEDSFKRLETFRDQGDRDAWRQEVLDSWDLIKLYRSRGRWPRHSPTSCYAYNRMCEYYVLCESGPCGQVNEDLKRSNYVKLPARD